MTHPGEPGRQVRAELQALYQRVPWSAEPLDAWETHENAWRPSSRPASPGWDPQDATEIVRLRKRELELSGTIVTHPYWSEFAWGDVLAARTALKTTTSSRRLAHPTSCRRINDSAH
ncbi:hypothetical protein OG925_01375 [Streptomyces canus]|nr:hypothetical protein OG925_01375 [Streptomyces canus]